MFLGDVLLGIGFDGIVTTYPGYQETKIKYYYHRAGLLSSVGFSDLLGKLVCLVAVMVVVSYDVPAVQFW